MRELEFLPNWYGLARTRKRVLKIQVWIVAMLAVCTGGWLIYSQHNIACAEGSLAGLNAQLQQSQSLLDELDRQLDLEQRLVTRERINGKLGQSVEMTRLLSTLEKVMPKEMSMLELDVTTDEQVKPVVNAAGVKAAKTGDPMVDRKLKVRILAVAPTDLDMVNFLDGLAKFKCFEQVSPTYFRDRIEANHVMREFEVSFWININESSEAN